MTWGDVLTEFIRRSYAVEPKSLLNVSVLEGNASHKHSL